MEPQEQVCLFRYKLPTTHHEASHGPRQEKCSDATILSPKSVVMTPLTGVDTPITTTVAGILAVNLQNEKAVQPTGSMAFEWTQNPLP